MHCRKPCIGSTREEHPCEGAQRPLGPVVVTDPLACVAKYRLGVIRGTHKFAIVRVCFLLVLAFGIQEFLNHLQVLLGGRGLRKVFCLTL